MKKLINLFASALLATSFLAVPVQALESTQSVDAPIYAACEGAGSDNPTDILSCNGRR